MGGNLKHRKLFKNITINLCGQLFAIDEDAYELLSTYEQSLRNYFRQREGGEEIADDIEARIAELLNEQKQSGTEAITIDHVREVIHRIGKPEELEGEEASSDSSQKEGKPSGSNEDDSAQPHSSLTGGVGSGPAGGKATKRLYRDPADKKLMGVLSGFAAYFGGDVLWWRLGFAACVLLSFVVPAASISLLQRTRMGYCPHRCLHPARCLDACGRDT